MKSNYDINKYRAGNSKNTLNKVKAKLDQPIHSYLTAGEREELERTVSDSGDSISRLIRKALKQCDYI